MRIKYQYITWLVTVIPFLIVSCADFIEEDLPGNQLVREDVFASEETARAAMDGLYFNLFQVPTQFSNGGEYSITAICGLSANELNSYSILSIAIFLDEFDSGIVNVDNTFVLNVWASSYNTIYTANSIIEGLQQPYADAIIPELRQRWIGEAKFIRAFTHFYLVNLFGYVPLVATTDYRVNGTATQNNREVVYQQVIEDLKEAIESLDHTYEEDRTRPNKGAAQLLLSRVFLYLEQWEQAERWSTEVILQNSLYEIEEDLDAVFLADSNEALWQIKPVLQGNTREGNRFILVNSPAYYALNEELLAAFDPADKRLTNWIGSYSSDTDTWYFPYKYKVQTSTGNPTEYSMVLRFAEAYLIRAEARAQQNRLQDAITDLDVIRGRAGIDLLSDNQSSVSQPGLLVEIQKERQRELFTEWGHRWFDLIRTGTATENISHGDWVSKNFLFPIPQSELEKNPNLNQNIGYN
ncbi:RagB/SusD family nutrient uptake outer membrane protein [Sinomicrobium sp. M5D2P9]